jgi:hypothetical protein
LAYDAHMPTEEEIRETALKIFYEENPEATTNPEEYELRAPEGHYYLLARKKLMSGEREDLLKALSAYEEEVTNITGRLKELGEKPIWPPEEEKALTEKIVELENRLDRTQERHEKTKTEIETLNSQRALLEQKIKELQAQPSVKAEIKEEAGAAEHYEQKAKQFEEAGQPQAAKELRKIGETEITHRETLKKIEKEKPPKRLESEKVSKPEEKKPRKRVRTLTPSKKSLLESSTEAMLHIYDSTLRILEEGIKKGATNVTEGLMALMLYADILHGGAYKVEIDLQPYFMEHPEPSPFYAGNIKNSTGYQGLLGAILDLLGVTKGQSAVEEILQNANVPHIFPKIISDQTYAMFRVLNANLTTTDLFKSAGTGVTTFVEAGTAVVKAATEAEKAQLEVIEKLTKLIPSLAEIAAKGA